MEDGKEETGEQRRGKGAACKEMEGKKDGADLSATQAPFKRVPRMYK